jgi:uncharacterized protein
MIPTDVRRRGLCRSGAVGLSGYAYRSPEAEVRSTSADGTTTIAGYAVVWNRYSQNLGGYVEQFAPDALDDSLRDDDQIASYNHDYATILGRRSAATLALEKDNVGLRYVIEGDAADPDVQRVAAKVRAKSVVGSSFTFRSAPDGETWSWTSEGFPVVTVNKARLFEVAPVVWPAYLATEEDGLAVGLRSLAQQSGRALDDLVDAARQDRLRDFLSSTPDSERATPAPSIDNLRRRLRLAELAA